MASVGEKYYQSLGQLQLPRMSAEEHKAICQNVCYTLSGPLKICLVPTIIKREYGDADIYTDDPIDKIRGVIEAFYPNVRIIVNDRCLSFEHDGYQVDIISILGQLTAVLFYGNNLGLIIHPMLKKTPFSLGTNGLFLRTPHDGKFVLSVDILKICEFLGLPRTIIIEDLTPEQLFELIARSNFFSPSEAIFEKRLLTRPVVAGFVKFCKDTPSSGATPPSAEDALAFFGQEGDYAIFRAEEEEQARLVLISKEQEKKQAAVKKQLSAAITAKGIKGKEVGTQFDSFKEWISSTKGMSYEEWAQTEPDVAKAFQEFCP